MQKGQPERILVVAMQGLGNVLLATPLLHSLRLGFPKAAIEALVLPNGSQEALAHNEDVSRVMVVSRRNSGLRGGLALAASLRSRRYDAAVVAWPGGLRSALLALLSGAPLRVGHPQATRAFKLMPFLYTRRLPVNGQKHDLERNLELAEALGLPASPDTAMRLPMTAPDLAWADRFTSSSGLGGGAPLVGLHPGSGASMSYKRWPAEAFATLGDALVDRLGAKVILFGGPGEQELMDRVAASMRHAPVAAPDAGIRQTAALIGRCRIFASNDSGLMHVAVAMGVPTVGVFGPTDHRRTAPYGERSRVARLGLPCSPCFRFQKGGFNCPRQRECLTALSPASMMAVVDELVTLTEKEGPGLQSQASGSAIISG